MGKNERDMKYQEDKSTLVGTQSRILIDKETGEEMNVQQTLKLVYGSKRFWKCYMKEFIKVMKSLTGSQFNVFVYIVENITPGDNKFIGTYSKIAEELHCSRQTVATAIRQLKESNFIRKVHNGVWLINPNVLMKGDDGKRHRLLEDYEELIPASEKEQDIEKRKNDIEKEQEEALVKQTDKLNKFGGSTSPKKKKDTKKKKKDTETKPADT